MGKCVYNIKEPPYSLNLNFFDILKLWAETWCGICSQPRWNWILCNQELLLRVFNPGMVLIETCCDEYGSNVTITWLAQPRWSLITILAIITHGLQYNHGHLLRTAYKLHATRIEHSHSSTGHSTQLWLADKRQTNL